MRLSSIGPSLLAVCTSIFLIACSGSGGGANSGSSGSLAADNSVSGTLVTKRTFQELKQPVSAPLSGDGIWNYSVATDYYWGLVKGGIQPSLVADFKANGLSQKITYAFPVFGNLDQDANGSYISNQAQTNCYNNKTATALQVFSYVALPQLKPTFIPQAIPALGDCVDGALATAYYKNTVGIPRVVPVVEMSARFNSAIIYTTNSTDPKKIDMDQLTDLAVTIANTILADSSVYGVAFDNEPAISKATSTAPIPTANCQGLDLEAAFYGTLAHTLASGANGPKYLFLFDAPDTARSLYTGVQSALDPNGKPCPYSVKFPALPNIVMMPALYDLEKANDDYASGPVDLKQYSSLVASSLKSAFAIAGDPPSMVVLPASATDTMWSSLQTYNVGINGKKYIPPTTLTIPSTCNQDATVVGTLDYVAVTSLICGNSNVNSCPNYLNPVTSPSTNVANFLSMCTAYQNKNTSGANVVMNDYFSSALSALNTNGIAGNGSSRYLGASLYAWRIAATTDLQGAVSFYSVYGYQPDYKPTSALLPMQITQDAWSSYLSWYNSSRPK